jgi:hypothetical protein
VGRGGAEPGSRTLDANQSIAAHGVDGRDLNTTEWNVADVGTAREHALDDDGYVADVGTAQATLDDNGYVADVGTAQAALDDDGHVADVGFVQATLDNDGYVADVGTAQVLPLDADTSDKDTCPSSISGCEENGSVGSTRRPNDDAQLEGGRLDAGSAEQLAVAVPLVDAGADSERQSSAASAQQGVAARSARQPSLYLGFGGGGGDPSSSGVCDEGGTRL